MLEDLTLTQTTSTSKWEADDPWRDWFLYAQKMMEASNQILSMQIQEEEDKRVLQVMKNLSLPKSTLSYDSIYPSGIRMTATQTPTYFGVIV